MSKQVWQVSGYEIFQYELVRETEKYWILRWPRSGKESREWKRDHFPVFDSWSEAVAFLRERLQAEIKRLETQLEARRTLLAKLEEPKYGQNL